MKNYEKWLKELSKEERAELDSITNNVDSATKYLEANGIDVEQEIELSQKIIQELKDRVKHLSKEIKATNP